MFQKPEIQRKLLLPLLLIKSIFEQLEQPFLSFLFFSIDSSSVQRVLKQVQKKIGSARAFGCRRSKS
ncbi:MAG: hypothetical protein QWI73_04990 [Alphaproteobacteria bacterium]|nr:hypothetical protein [Alphaproteobacteria bacterium]